MLRNNHQRCSVRKGVLKNFEKFTGKHLCQSLLFNKIEALRSATLLKKRLWHSCFPVNFPKFLRTPFLQNISGRLLLNAVKLDSVKLQKQQYTPIPSKAKQNSKILLFTPWISLYYSTQQYYLSVSTIQTNSRNCMYYTKNLCYTINSRKNCRHRILIKKAIVNCIQQPSEH